MLTKLYYNPVISIQKYTGQSLSFVHFTHSNNQKEVETSTPPHSPRSTLFAYVPMVLSSGYEMMVQYVMSLKELLATASFKIFRRGKDYYDNNMISSYSVDTRTKSIVAHVKGKGSGAPYEVRIELDLHEAVSDHSCSCPFTSEPLCKHEVAVLLAALEGVPSSLSPLEYDFDARTNALLPENESERYRIALSEIIDGRMMQGYLDDEACWTVSTRLREELCTFQRDTNHSRVSVLRYTLEMLSAINRLEGNADDYHEGLSDLQQLCFENLSEIVDDFVSSPRDDDGLALYQELIEKAEEEFSIDLQEPLYEIAARWGDLDEGWFLLASLKRLADAEAHEPAPTWGRLVPMNTLLYYRYLKMFDFTQSQQFQKDNLRIPEIRADAIEMALVAEDFSYAEKLCLDGIAQEDKATSWKTKPYLERLVETYTLSNNRSDEAKLVHTASELCFGFKDANHYETLKNASISLGTWDDNRESILAKVVATFPAHQATNILLNEHEWQGALLLVQKNRSLVYQFFRELNPYFPQEIAACFQADIEDFTRYASYNGKYDDLCNKLLTMTEACGTDAVLPLINMLQTTYKQRRNMQKDLRYLTAFMKYKTP